MLKRSRVSRREKKQIKQFPRAAAAGVLVFLETTKMLANAHHAELFTRCGYGARAPFVDFRKIKLDRNNI